MDIKGAKALKKRLGTHGEVGPQPAPVDGDLPEDAPPVYQWLGLRPPKLEKPPEADELPA